MEFRDSPVRGLPLVVMVEPLVPAGRPLSATVDLPLTPLKRHPLCHVEALSSRWWSPFYLTMRRLQAALADHRLAELGSSLELRPSAATSADADAPLPQVFSSASG